MNNMITKLDNPVRVAELSPVETLKRIGITSSSVVCDIGAGTGVFTIPAAKLTEGLVYAFDINLALIEVIKEKAARESLTNVISTDVVGFEYPIVSNSADIVLLVTVLHEIDDKDALMHEIKEILKIGGKLAVIEFFESGTPVGPPPSHRISEESVNVVCEGAGLTNIDRFVLSENLYCTVFEKQK